jgi:hypothetical protein
MGPILSLRVYFFRKFLFPPPKFLFSPGKLREIFSKVFFKEKKVSHRQKIKENLGGKGRRNYIEKNFGKRFPIHGFVIGFDTNEGK